jgi:predicted dithiol-disulfide oxidoreductase (DUF899 family)
MNPNDFDHPRIVTREEWLVARRAHLKNEKALTRMRDLVAADRRQLPWVKIEKEYSFATPAGRKSLAELFGRNRQLIIHHFMFAPDWEAGCSSCSLDADHAEGAITHLENHEVTYVRVSRAPLDKIEAYRKRMGWNASWVSSHGSDFNYDFGVSFTAAQLAAGQVEYNYGLVEGSTDHPGLSVFCQDENGAVYHTYSSYARGNEEVAGVFVYLDLTPKGRNESEIMDWVKRHDEY